MTDPTTVLPGTEPHPHARAVLGAALGPGAPPSHAYLFHGPEGTGKRAVARAFAAELLAAGAPDPDGVRERVARGVHPDLTWVAPSGAHELLVEDVREPVVAAAARTPFEAERRVFVIERADTMNDEAANRLLKTLEEPAPFVHVVLLTSRLTEVLPTIVSRCQLVRFDPLPPEQIAARLEGSGAEPQAAAAAARLALGDGERARRLVTGDGPALRAAAEDIAAAALGRGMRAHPWRALLDAMRARGAAAEAEVKDTTAAEAELLPRRERRRRETEGEQRARRARRRAERETLDLGLQLTSLWFRDLACLAHGAPELVLNVDRREQLEGRAAAVDAQRLREAIELVEETRRRLELNVTEELAAEALGYRLERVLAA